MFGKLINKFSFYIQNFRFNHSISELESRYITDLGEALSLFPSIEWVEDIPDSSCSGIIILQDDSSKKIHACYFDFRKTWYGSPVWILHTDSFSDSNYIVFGKFGLFEWEDSYRHSFHVKKFWIFENFT